MAASRRKLVTLIEEAATAATPKKEPDAGKVTFSVGGKKPASPLLAADKSRTVMMLRPRTPLLLDGTQSVSSAAKKMHDMNTDAALVIDVTGKLTGIITDTDVTRKVLSKHPAAFPELVLTSSEKGDGIATLRSIIATLD